MYILDFFEELLPLTLDQQFGDYVSLLLLKTQFSTLGGSCFGIEKWALQTILSSENATGLPLGQSCWSYI